MLAAWAGIQQQQARMAALLPLQVIPVFGSARCLVIKAFQQSLRRQYIAQGRAIQRALPHLLDQYLLLSGRQLIKRP
ncbi:hypothetical protein CWI66_05485 [Halomonas sp. 141]|nr:hypothetical protein CWI66_05485 [Halomonas sp. 141]